MARQRQVGGAFAAAYPTIAHWVEDCGYIEIGYDDCNQSFARALDIGGMVWEGEYKYGSVNEALQAMEAGIAAWMEEQGME